jgi:hypothetical protein
MNGRPLARRPRLRVEVTRLSSHSGDDASATTSVEGVAGGHAASGTSTWKSASRGEIRAWLTVVYAPAAAPSLAR